MATRRIPRTTVRALFSPECRPQTHASRRHPCEPNSHARTLFTLPQLDQHDSWTQHGLTAKVKDGAAEGGERSVRLYSAPGYKMAWTVHQSHLIYNLNYMTTNDPDAQTKPPLAIAQRYARDPAQAVLFNHASQAHNNNFYFEGLTDRPRPLSDFAGLHANLERAFGSIDALRDLVRYTADGIFGSGYVWLVWVSRGAGSASGDWRVLATYNAGTPYVVGAGADRAQSKDMNTVRATAGSFGNYSELSGQAMRARQLGGPGEICPVLCVSVWEHSFIRDFSVHGKKQFVDAWWDCIDWQTVNNRAPGPARENRDLFQPSLHH